MQLRRALLALLMIMVVSAFAAALVRRLAAGPAQPGTRTELVTEPSTTSGDAQPRRDPGKARTESAPDDAEVLNLRAGQSRPAAFEKGTHLIVTVASREPGQAFIEGLGQLEPVTPGTPARFDLFLDRRGEFPVRVRPVEGTKDLDAGALRVGPVPTGARPGA